ncbi:MAG: hypothetical protein AAB403_08750 [Planctomycetota bacterium]
MKLQALLLSALLPLPAMAQVDFSVVAGKVCRGYYNQAEGGTGQLERPEAAFKTGTINQDGSFFFTAVRAAPGTSRGWDTNSGNTYLLQGNTSFKVQPDGSWFFPNHAGGSRYYLTYVGPNTSGGIAFTVRYEHGSGSAVGKALCTEK